VVRDEMMAGGIYTIGEYLESRKGSRILREVRTYW
jgi:hypothetical protein